MAATALRHRIIDLVLPAILTAGPGEGAIAFEAVVGWYIDDEAEGRRLVYGRLELGPRLIPLLREYDQEATHHLDREIEAVALDLESAWDVPADLGEVRLTHAGWTMASASEPDPQPVKVVDGILCVDTDTVQGRYLVEHIIGFTAHRFGDYWQVVVELSQGAHIKIVGGVHDDNYPSIAGPLCEILGHDPD